jgi:phosphomannomutase / phosphoglucomutase
MRWDLSKDVRYNSFDYFDKTLITDNGFREYDVRWLLDKKEGNFHKIEINPNGFVVLGKAYATYMQTRYQERRIVVGNDFRRYSQDLCRSFIVGLLSAGAEVIDIGLAITPIVYFAQHHLQVRGAAAITASHNENGWTGLKLAKGLSSTLGPEEIQDFKQLVMSGKFHSGSGTYQSFDGMDEIYSADLLKGGPLKRKLKVVLAAGNGTAGRFAPPVLKALGAEIIELDCNGDWDFPNHNPNPEDLSFLHSISKRIEETGADLGIGIDGDGDRIGVVDNNLREIFSDKLGLLLGRWLSEKEPGRSIVIDVKSTGLYDDDPILRKNKMEVVMWKTGHSYIKAKVAETNAMAGFEKSGHWFLNAPFGRGYDDAVLSSVYVLRFLSEAGQSLSSLVDALPRTWSSPTLGVDCPDNVKYDVVADMARQYQADFKEHRKIAGHTIKSLIDVNGIRFVLDDSSWGLVRASSNKPSLVVVAEARSSEDELYEIVEHIQSRLAASGKIGEWDQQLPARQSRA